MLLKMALVSAELLLHFFFEPVSPSVKMGMNPPPPPAATE